MSANYVPTEGTCAMVQGKKPGVNSKKAATAPVPCIRDNAPDRFKFRVYVKSLGILANLGWFCFEAGGSISLLTAEGRMMNLKQDDVILEQCAEHKDVHESTSYEGDKVKILANRNPYFKSEHISEDNYGVIVWDSEHHSFVIELRFILAGQFEGQRHLPLYNTTFEIIGNIHDKE